MFQSNFKVAGISISGKLYIFLLIRAVSAMLLLIVVLTSTIGCMSECTLPCGYCTWGHGLVVNSGGAKLMVWLGGLRNVFQH